MNRILVLVVILLIPIAIFTTPEELALEPDDKAVENISLEAPVLEEEKEEEG